MVRGLPIAFEVIPTQAFQLAHRLRRTGVQRPRNSGLLRASSASKGALQGRIHPHRDIALGDGLGPTQHTHQRIEQFVHGLILDGLLRDLHLLAQRGKELEPAQIFAQRTKTGPPTLQLARFGHGALLLRSGNASWPRAFPSAIRFIGVRLARFSAALKVLLPCAKNWQLAPPEWYERYAKRVENYALPKLEAARQALARVIAAWGAIARRCRCGGRAALSSAGPGSADLAPRLGRTVHR